MSDVAVCTLSLPCFLSPFLISPAPFLRGGCRSPAADAFWKCVRCAFPTFPGMASPAAALCTRCRGWWPAHTASSSPWVKRTRTSFLWVRTRVTAPKHWREKGTAVGSTGTAQPDAACSCSHAAGLLLTPDPGPRLQREQIRSGLTAAHWGEA